MSVAFKILDGYPAPGPGGKTTVVAEIPGPSSYDATTGQVIKAADFGFGGIDSLKVLGVSYSGTYMPMPKWGTAANQGPVQTVGVHWYAVAGGAEAAGSADLDADMIRVELVLI